MEKDKDIKGVFGLLFNNEDEIKLATLLYEKLEEGSIAIAEKDLKTEFDTDFLNKYTKDKILPFVFENGNIYFHRYFKYETFIIDSIKRLIECKYDVFLEKKDDIESIITDFVEKVFPVSVENEVNWQKVAIINSVYNTFNIITGGPGTGKTWTVTYLLALLFTIKNDAKVALVAPTGKAAMRLKESIRNTLHGDIDNLRGVSNKLEEINALTIHRLLGFGKSGLYFHYNSDNKLPYDLIVVDESSMIDVALMAKLLNAVNDGTKVILLGDSNQLASVEAGSVFGDLCRAQDKENYFEKIQLGLINSFLFDNEKISDNNIVKNSNLITGKIITLKKNFRAKEHPGIISIAQSIIDGNRENIKPNEDVEVISNIENVEKELIKYITDYEGFIKESDIKVAIRALNKVKILCALNEGRFGVDEMNRLVENYLKSKKLIEPKGVFYHNMPVMMTYNDYDKNLYNGDVGLIRTDKNGKLKVYFLSDNEDVKSFDPYNINGLVKNFAMTIHKSQGSEFEKVIILLPTNTETRILTRELIYTAVTRAKNKVYMFVNDDVMEYVLNNTALRSSGITNRIKIM